MNGNTFEAQLFSVEDAGRLLGGISPWTLRKHIAVGNVRVTHIGRRVFVDEEEMSRIVRNGLPSLGSRKRSGNHGHVDDREGRGQVSPTGGSAEQESQEFVAAGTPDPASSSQITYKDEVYDH